MRFENLSIAVTRQVPDGCVTASARSFIPELGIPFDSVFFPILRDYSLDKSNPENNHMLGVAIAAAKLGLSVEIHRGALLAGDILPANAPQQAQLIHPSVVRELMELHANGQIGIEISALDVEKMRQLLQKQLSLGRYGLVMLDWERWDVEVQKSYGNPRHIVTVFGLNGENVAIMDPARPEGENLVTSPLRRLYAALNDKQQMIFIGPKETNADNNNLV